MEGLPVSIIEYMKSELLVISSNVGGCNELVKDNINGFLLQQNNPKEIALALQKVIEKKCDIDAMKKQSKVLFDEIFSKDIFFKNLEEKSIYKF
jgi:glycosyltransferase involved in cell wall biosynthesis